MLLWLPLLALYVSGATGLKILVYQTGLGHSHMHFSGTLIDVLANAGHEVHLLIADWNPASKGVGTTRIASSRHIRLDGHSTSLTKMSYLQDPFRMPPSKFVFLDSKQRQLLENLLKEFCALMASDDELLTWIRTQHFDLALTAMYGGCQYGLFHLAGIKLVMGFVTTPAAHYILNAVGIDTPSSYTNVSQTFCNTLYLCIFYSICTSCLFFDLPITNGQSDDMSYWIRALNFLVQNFMYHYVVPDLLKTEQQIWDRKYGPSFPRLPTLARNVTFVFVNTDELVEFPRPISHKIIYIGGIGIEKPQKVNERYDKLLSLRPGTVLFSFGSLARTALMPREMMLAFLEAFSNFSNYTFIWKTDAETRKLDVFSNYPNVELVEWMPQNDLLNDGRINAFITHAGLNSLEECTHAGVPMITLPLFGDQIHNAAVVAKRHIGYPLYKDNITKQSVTEALQAVLYDERYSKNAKQLKMMINDKPTSDVKRIFLEYVEYAARYPNVGDHLQLHAVNLTWIQLYCIDFIVPATAILVLLLYIIWKVLLLVIRKFVTHTFDKLKSD